MKLEKGYTHIYAGSGKGKTSAAVGLAIRARGAGLKVCFLQFLKGGRQASSEVKILKKSGVKVIVFDEIHPIFGGNKNKLKKSVRKDFRFVKKRLEKVRCNVVIFDEILNLVSENYLKAESLISLIKAKPESVELVLTGRKAPKAVLKYADYITQFNKLSHPYESQILARKGIEY